MLVWLILPLFLLAAGALAVNTRWKADGFFVSLATELVGIMLTVAYVNWVLRRHEAEIWHGTDKRIRDRARIFVNALLSGLRSTLGFGFDILDETEVMSGDPERGHREVLRMATQLLAPAARARLDRLDQAGWSNLAEHLKVMWEEAERLIDRFGSRLSPIQLELVLDIQQALQAATIFWQTFPDLAGVPDDELPIRKTPPEILKAVGYDSTAKELRTLIGLASRLAQECSNAPLTNGRTMSIFTDAERNYLTEMRAIATDAQGQEVLVGLTEEETAFYMEYTRRRLQGEGDRQDGHRYLELHEKHERARLAVLGAEIYHRNENPPRHWVRPSL